MSKLQQCDAGFFTGAQSLLVPQADLYLADMTRTKQQHAQTGLTDAAADGLGQFSMQKHLMEGEIPALVAAGLFKLAVQSCGIHPDTCLLYTSRCV